MTSQVESPTPPPLVVELARGRRLVPVWRNEIGGTTWRAGDGVELTYLKVGPLHWEFDPVQDAERLRWLSGYVSVPEPVSVGERDGWGWLETLEVPGSMVVDGVGSSAARFRERAPETLRALGAALRHFHDTVPAGDCPWTWSAADRLAQKDAAAAALLSAPPALDAADRVVCHGDACNPNFQLHDDLTLGGYVDLGNAGVGDRWADLAPATLSVAWNFGPGLSHHLLDGYGIGRDLPMRAQKLRWYVELWNAPEHDTGGRVSRFVSMTAEDAAAGAARRFGDDRDQA